MVDVVEEDVVDVHPINIIFSGSKLCIYPVIYVFNMGPVYEAIVLFTSGALNLSGSFSIDIIANLPFG